MYGLLSCKPLRLPAYACYGTIFIVECKYTMKKENAYEKKIRFNSNNNFA